MNETVKVALIGLVAAVWVANFAAQFFVAGYTPDPTVAPVFMLVAGGLFAIPKRKGSDSSGQEDDQ